MRHVFCAPHFVLAAQCLCFGLFFLEHYRIWIGISAYKCPSPIRPNKRDTAHSPSWKTVILIPAPFIFHTFIPFVVGQHRVTFITNKSLRPRGNGSQATTFCLRASGLYSRSVFPNFSPPGLTPAPRQINFEFAVISSACCSSLTMSATIRPAKGQLPLGRHCWTRFEMRRSTMGRHSAK